MYTLLRSAALAGAILTATPALAAEVRMQPSDVGSVSVDATVYHLATPDVVNMNVSCEAQKPGSKQQVRAEFRSMLQKMVSEVGSSGTVRRNGTPGIYQYYGSGPMPFDSTEGLEVLYTGNMNVSVLDIKAGQGMRIGDAMEEMGCSVTWDARLLYTTKYAREQREELFEQLADKKLYFEQLLGVTLSKVSNIYVSTSQDGGYYGGMANYDPESNTLPAMTTLSVSYDIGTGAKK